MNNLFTNSKWRDLEDGDLSSWCELISNSIFNWVN